MRPQDQLPKDFCIDGRPLRLNQELTDAAGDPNVTVFQFVDNDASKIVRYSDASNKFELYRPDGTMYFYGTSSGSRRDVGSPDVYNSTVTDAWHLTSVSDRFHNTIQFYYYTERYVTSHNTLESAVYLDRIFYSANSGVTGEKRPTSLRMINFRYKEKVDALGETGGYHHDVPVDDRRLLESITVDTFDGTELHPEDRIYTINYEPTPGNGIQRVTSVQECTSSDGEVKCLSPTTFSYDDAAIALDEPRPRRFANRSTGVIDVADRPLNYIAEGDPKATLNPAIPFDADGDGYKDLLQAYKEFNLIWYWHAEPDGYGQITFRGPIAVTGPSPKCLSASHVGDLDGDGRDEILDGCPLTRNRTYVSYFNIDANGAVTEAETSELARSGVYLADIDGNGRPDIVQETAQHVYYTEFSSFDEGEETMNLTLTQRVSASGQKSSGSNGALEPLLLDIDGDGVRNLLRFDVATKQFYALALKPNDELTEDERNQVGVYEDGAVQRIGRWTPTGLSYQVSPLTGGPGHIDSIRVLDINGDGLDDVWVQSARLIAPLDPELGRIPDIFTGEELDASGDIARANQLVKSFFPGGVVLSGPSQLWINTGGAFRLKSVVLNTWNGEPIVDGSPQCPVTTEDGACVALMAPWTFRRSTVLDYDNDGRDEMLLFSEGYRWSRTYLDSETTNRVHLSIEHLPDLPNDPGLHQDGIDNSPYTAFESLPVWSDFNSDANLDMLIVGLDDEPENRVLVMGTGQGNGRRLARITDGLGNTVNITHARDRSNLDLNGPCGESPIWQSTSPRCLRGLGSVVARVDRGTATGRDFGGTAYAYEHPATADFLQGYYFTARTMIEYSGADEQGESLVVARVKEEFGQALLNEIFSYKHTYPLLTKPTLRVVELSEEPNFEGLVRGRSLVEENFYEIQIGGMPHLAESERTILDALGGGYFVPVVRRKNVFTLDAHGLPSVHEQWVYTSDPDEPIASSRIHTSRTPDIERWILDKVALREVTSTRNGVSRTKSTTFGHDPETGFVTSKTENRDGSDRDLVTEYSPDSFGNIREVKQISSGGEEDRITTIDYGRLGIYPVSIENAEGHVRQYEFDPVWGGPTLIEDENGYQLVQLYDGFGRLVHAEGRNGTEVANFADIVYSKVNEPYEVEQVAISAVVRKTTTSGLFSGEITEDYDSRGLLVRSKQPGLGIDGETPELFSEASFDWAGRPTLRSEPHEEGVPAVWNSVDYDLRGRPTATSSPAGSLHFRYASWVHFEDAFPEWTFPDAVEMVGVIDAEGRQTATVADHNGNAVVSAEGCDFDGGAPGLVTRTMRGPWDQPTVLVDPELHEIHTEYDNDGLVSWTEDADRGRTDFFYDAFGNVKRTVPADLVESTFTYDRINRPLTRLDAGTDLTEWVYDIEALGRLEEMVGPTGVRTVFGYEDSPRALRTTETYHLNSETFTSSTEFDSLGRPIRFEYPQVERPGDDFELAVRPAYDPYSGQLIAVQSDDRQADYWRITDGDSRGRVREVTLGNGVRETYAFDPTTQLLSDLRVLNEHGQLSHLSYDYYANGQVEERTLEHGATTRSRTVVYDTARRLHSVTESGPGAVSETFGFSPGGRLESRSKFGAYEYDEDHPHALAGVNGNEFTYDIRGNQETRTGPAVPGETQTFSYTRFNRPSEVLFGDPDAPDKTVSFEYDARGMRVAKRESGGAEVLSVGAAYERVTPITGGVWGIQHKFRIFGNGREIAQVVFDESTEESTIVYLHRDQLASVLFTTDAEGTSSELRDFDVFGQPRTHPSWADLTRESFTGHERDTEMALVDAGARLYDSMFGVFTSPDPMRVSGFGSQAFNPYA